MNANKNYFVYTQKNKTYMIDRRTGKIEPVTVVGETTDEQQTAVHAVYKGMYPNYMCRLIFQTESGEQFGYPFSYGYASPEYIQEIINAAESEKPSYLTAEVIARRQSERAKSERENLRRTHPKTAIAYDIIEALNQPERFNRVWLNIQLIAMTMHSGASHLRDEDEKQGYRELKSIFSETDAELPDFRNFMEEVAEWLGY